MTSCSLDGRKILVVEDEWLIAEHLVTILEDIGCHVVGTAATVADGLDKISAESIDCVFLDANLGRENSAPVADALELLSVPFVMATGYGELALNTPAMDAAPRLAKPYLQHEVEQILSGVFAL